MLSFIVDTQLPPSLARWLKAKGCDAVHTTFFPNGYLMTDIDIRLVAIRESRIIVSKDSDFFADFLFKGTPPRVLFLKFGNCSNRDLLAQFEIYFDRVRERFEQGAGLVLFSWNKIAEY